jgi:Putative zinc-finger
MSAACEQWHGAIATDALGALEPEERLGLLAHLDGCAACREVASELHQTASALAHADRDQVAPTASVPPALTERVLGSLRDDALAARRRRRTKVAGALAGVVALAASLAILLAIGSPTAARSRTEVLTGSPTATATAVLSSRPWGTSIAFTEHGLPVGAVFSVSMRTSSGAWWTAGSFTAPLRGTPPSMACYVALDQITGIRVTDASGTAVLHDVAAPGTRW